MTEFLLKSILRFVFGGVAVVLSAVIAKKMGGKVGGIFAAFPAVYLSAIIAVGVSVGASKADAAVFSVSKGALIGMIANIACAVFAAKLIPVHGWKKGLGYALLIWLVIASVIYFSVFQLGIMG